MYMKVIPELDPTSFVILHCNKRYYILDGIYHYKVQEYQTITSHLFSISTWGEFTIYWLNMCILTSEFEKSSWGWSNSDKIITKQYCCFGCTNLNVLCLSDEFQYDFISLVAVTTYMKWTLYYIHFDLNSHPIIYFFLCNFNLVFIMVYFS